MIQGMIFDVDGTLLDSMYIWEQLGERYLLSVNKTPEARLSQKIFSMTFQEGIRYIKNRYDIPGSEREIEEKMAKILQDFYEKEVAGKIGAIQFIQTMKKKNIPLVIATSGDKATVEKTFDRLNIRECFKAILTCKELNTSKRTPDIYLKGAEIMGTIPGETVVFEDVLYAVRSAKKAGFITVAIEDEASKEDKEEIKRISDFYIKDFTDPILSIF